MHGPANGDPVPHSRENRAGRMVVARTAIRGADAPGGEALMTPSSASVASSAAASPGRVPEAKTERAFRHAGKVHSSSVTAPERGRMIQRK